MPPLLCERRVTGVLHRCCSLAIAPPASRLSLTSLGRHAYHKYKMKILKKKKKSFWQFPGAQHAPLCFLAFAVITYCLRVIPSDMNFVELTPSFCCLSSNLFLYYINIKFFVFLPNYLFLECFILCNLT